MVEGDVMNEIGSVREFSTGTFELIGNEIVPEKQKNNFLIKLNIYTLLFLFLFLGLSVGAYLLIYEVHYTGFGLLGLIFLFLSFVIYIVVHELLHGFAFIIFNKNKFKELKFGIELKSGMAYCISTIPVKVGPGRLSLMMPVYVVCLPLYIFAMMTGDIWLIIVSVIFLSGSTGDFYYMWKLKSTDKHYYMYEEMPTKSGYEIGYLLYKKID